MMRDPHLTHVEIEKLVSGQLTPAEILFVGRHLADCAACRAEARSVPAAQSVGAVFEPDDLDHPDAERDIPAYVDGTLPQARRIEMARHVAACPRCREDVSDLIPLRRRSALALPLAATLAAAAVIAVIFTVYVVVAPRGVQRPLQRRGAVVKTEAHSEWDAAVRDAIARGIARPAILTDIRPASGILRGTSDSETATLHPTGEVIESTRPELTWTPFAGARYVVSISDGKRVLASSGEIASASWTPPQPLPRATTLTWQVELRRGGRSETIPAPPRPPAMFRIIDETTARELAEAERERPNDHLLLGVLHARAGLQTRAERELQSVSSPEAARILDGIRRW